MFHGADRLPTTHVGGLAWPEALLDIHDARNEGRDSDATAFADGAAPVSGALWSVA